jgi:hypothetical protein
MPQDFYLRIGKRPKLDGLTTSRNLDQTLAIDAPRIVSIVGNGALLVIERNRLRTTRDG